VLAGARASFEGMLQARGTEVHFQAHLVPELGPDRNARGFYLLAYDQTELKQAERRSAAGEQRLRAVTDNLPVLIAFIDAQQRYEFCNATYREWLGVDPQALIGRTVRETLGDERYAPRAPYIERALAGERLEFVAEQRTLTGLRQLQTLYVPQCADDGRVQGVYALVHDVTEIKQAEQRMAELARSDALTGLPNRRCIEERLADALARARRSGAPMAVLFLDVDRFKTINDTLGHAVGDEVLREFAQRLKGALRETDAVGRLAGDEFVVVLENLKTEAQPQFVARKILAAIARPFELERGVLDVATSIGIAYLDDASLDGEAALKIADHALYQAKAGGRNTFRLGRR
jgi:diguanylate cyclase (GGDEF)-like protein/PAS domain S-box-containing protein